MFTLLKPSQPKSSRLQINIKGVKDNILTLPNNHYRVVLQVNSVNFELKSEAEQDLLIDNYQNFLNALPCPVQILFRVRAIDLDKYLETFNEKTKPASDAKQASQLEDYNHFVKYLVSNNKILSRSFYLVLPVESSTTDPSSLNQQFKLLEDIIKKGLERLGVQARRLSNLEILDLFYSFYNPEQAKTQPLTEQAINYTNETYLQGGLNA